MLRSNAKSNGMCGRRELSRKAAGGLGRLIPPHGDMDENDIDPELHDLVITLLTRIGMIMEDASPVALDAKAGGIQSRVLIVTNTNLH